MTNEEYNALIRALEVAKEHPGSLGAIIHVAQPHWSVVRDYLIKHGIFQINEFGVYDKMSWKKASEELKRLTE